MKTGRKMCEKKLEEGIKEGIRMNEPRRENV